MYVIIVASLNIQSHNHNNIYAYSPISNAAYFMVEDRYIRDFYLEWELNLDM